MSINDCYIKLGLDTNKEYTEKEIKKAYRLACKKNENRNNEDTKEEIKDILEAYRILKESGFKQPKKEHESFREYLIRLRDNKPGNEEKYYNKKNVTIDNALIYSYIYTKSMEYLNTYMTNLNLDELYNIKSRIEFLKLALVNVFRSNISYEFNENNLDVIFDVAIKYFYKNNMDSRLLYETAKYYKNGSGFCERLCEILKEDRIEKPYMYNSDEVKEAYANPNLSFYKYLEINRKNYYGEEKDLDKEFSPSIIGTIEYDAYKELSVKNRVNDLNIGVYTYLLELSNYYIKYINSDVDAIKKNEILKTIIERYLDAYFKLTPYLQSTREEFDRTLIFNTIAETINYDDEEEFRISKCAMEYVSYNNAYNNQIMEKIEMKNR